MGVGLSEIYGTKLENYDTDYDKVYNEYFLKKGKDLKPE